MEPEDHTENQPTFGTPEGTSLYYPPKLTEQEKVRVSEWFAEFKTPTQIRQLIKEQFGKDLTVQSIRGYVLSEKWQPRIQRLRQEYAAGVMEVPIAHKRRRLEMLLELFEETRSSPRLSPQQRIVECRHILSQAWREMEEGKGFQITNVYATQINEMSEKELLRRRDELIAKVTQWRPSNKTINVQPEQREST